MQFRNSTLTKIANATCALGSCITFSTICVQAFAQQPDKQGRQRPKPSVNKSTTAKTKSGEGTGGHGADGILQGGQVSLLDLVEFDHEFYFPDEQPYIAAARQKVHLLRRHLGAELDIGEAPNFNLAWAITRRPLKEISDEGTISYTPPGSKIQCAIQKDGLVLLSHSCISAMDQPSLLGTIIHEVLISRALKDGRDLSRPSGTQPIRKLTQATLDPKADKIDGNFFYNIWMSIPFSVEPPAKTEANLACEQRSHRFILREQWETAMGSEPNTRTSTYYEVDGCGKFIARRVNVDSLPPAFLKDAAVDPQAGTPPCQEAYVRRSDGRVVVAPMRGCK
jgi:hypothetical protein